MAGRRIVKSKKYLSATLVTGDRSPCAFCKQDLDDEATYGKLYAIGNLQCHYFCVLLSCCLVQHGKDTEGLFGFLYPDILAEIERSKKHKCSYCGLGGASLGCCVSACRKQFHLPCARRKHALSLFYGNFKSYCQMHAPKQKLPDHLMAVAKVRMKRSKAVQAEGADGTVVSEVNSAGQDCNAPADVAECVCLICYESVSGFPSIDTFWPPCCARDSWFHRPCLQRMALSSGMHYLKCPLCNDKDNFYTALLEQGYYVPDRDAAWELEENAFAEIYERTVACSSATCLCPDGREFDADNGSWCIKLCVLCGWYGWHAACGGGGAGGGVLCDVCSPHAPQDLDKLIEDLNKAAQAEQAASRANRQRLVMPSRMSLRRTKPALHCDRPSTSTTLRKGEAKIGTNTETSRSELNINTPRLRSCAISNTDSTQQNMDSTQKNTDSTQVLKNIENTIMSPVKMLKECLSKKIGVLGVKDIDSSVVVERAKARLRKPRPLSVKRRIVSNILDSLLDEILKENHHVIRQKSTPKKIQESTLNNTETQETREQTGIFKDETLIKIPIMQMADDNLNVKVVEKNLLDTTLKDDIEKFNEIDMNKDTSKAVEDDLLDTTSEKCNEVDIDDESSISKEINALHEDNVHKLNNAEVSEEKIDLNTALNFSNELLKPTDLDISLTLATPKKLKTVDFEIDSSLEISENEEKVNIDVIKMENTATELKVKMPLSSIKSDCKVSQKKSENNNEDLDMECFKNYYLTEVDKQFECNFNHDHINIDRDDLRSFKLKTAIDFAIDATIKEKSIPNIKRKTQNKDGVVIKKRKKGHSKDNKFVLKYNKDNNIKVVCSKERGVETVDLTVNTPAINERHKKIKENKRSKRDDIHVKIRFKKKQVKLRIIKSEDTKTKEKGKKKLIKQNARQKSPNLKQYILNYTECASSPTEQIAKPEQDATPKKIKKLVKQEKTPDNLVQTSIQNFFKVRSPVT